MQWLMALALSFVLVLAPFAVDVTWGVSAPPFPFATTSDAAKLQSASPIPACDNGGVRVELGDAWSVFSWPTRDLFIHYTDGLPDYVYLTVGSKDDPLKLVGVLTLEQAQKRFPSPCVYGNEVES